MAIFNEPAQWDHTLGNNADTSTLPDDAAATAGIASLQKLFQIINATPLEAGGIAPDREDVNALFKYLGDQIFYTQNGGVPSYNAAYDYIAGRVVLYNGNIYKCIQANGVSSTVVAPGSDTAYWQRLDNSVRSVNGVNADASGNVTLGIFPDYTARVQKVANTEYTAEKNGFIMIISNHEDLEVDIIIDNFRIKEFYNIGGAQSVFRIQKMVPIKKGSKWKALACSGWEAYAYEEPEKNNPSCLISATVYFIPAI